MNRLKRSLPCLLCLTLALTFVLTACGGEETQTPADTAAVVTELGEGATTFSFTSTDDKGTVSAYTIHTDAATVGEALEGLDLIAGEEGDYGLFVTTVGELTLPTDGPAYWAFYIDGEYAATGIDQTPVTEGASYELKVESM